MLSAATSAAVPTTASVTSSWIESSQFSRLLTPALLLPRPRLSGLLERPGLVTVITTNISNEPGADKHLLLRWALYAASFAAILAWLAAAYLRAMSTRKRKLPWAETAAALIAFAAWGLVMPGSPLAEALSTSNRNIWYPIIVTTSLLVLGLFGTPLQRKVRKA
jgi:hypothetical protein